VYSCYQFIFRSLIFHCGFGSLKPSTQRVLGLVAEVKSLQNDKENLRVNLHRAEDEVRISFEDRSSFWIVNEHKK